MLVNTNELIGPALDWAVAQADGHNVAVYTADPKKDPTATRYVFLIDRPWADKRRIKWVSPFIPSTAWAQGGPIIEREGISLLFHDNNDWTASNYLGTFGGDGNTALVAAMRCFAAMKLGDEVDIPEELLT